MLSANHPLSHRPATNAAHRARPPNGFCSTLHREITKTFPGLDHHATHFNTTNACGGPWSAALTVNTAAPAARPDRSPRGSTKEQCCALRHSWTQGFFSKWDRCLTASLHAVACTDTQHTDTLHTQARHQYNLVPCQPENTAPYFACSKPALHNGHTPVILTGIITGVGCVRSCCGGCCCAFIAQTGCAG